MALDDERTVLGNGGDDGRRAGLNAGDRLGDYRILRLLGAGAMGEVYEAEQVHLGVRYALKVLPQGLSGDEQGRERFRREARTLASLRHPHVVTVHNAGEAEGRFFLVMEKLRPLEDVEGAALPVEEVRLRLQAVLDGLAAAHDKGVLHRDLKPANLLLDDSGKIQIADFGVAQVLGEEFVQTLVTETLARSRMGSDSTLTSSGGSKFSDYAGTLLYMAPEVLEGKPADARSDLYAIGVMAYQWLTGRRPAGRFKAASTWREGLDSAWDVWIDRMLEQDPADRFESAQAAAQGLPSRQGSSPVATEGVPVSKPKVDPRPKTESEVEPVSKSREMSKPAPVPAPVPLASAVSWRTCLSHSLRILAWLGSIYTVVVAYALYHDPRPFDPELLAAAAFVGAFVAFFAFILMVPQVRGLRLLRVRGRRKSGVIWLAATVLPFVALGFVDVIGVILFFPLAVLGVVVVADVVARGFSCLRKKASAQPESFVGNASRMLRQHRRATRLAVLVVFLLAFFPKWYLIQARDAEMDPEVATWERLELKLANGAEMEFIHIPELQIWAGVHEVTNAQFRSVFPNHDSGRSSGVSYNGDDQPVVRVTMEDIAAFRAALAEHPQLAERGLRPRLPTEEERSALARCGRDRLYPWGNEPQPRRGNYADRNFARAFDRKGLFRYDDGYTATAPVDKSGRNEWGLYGLGGNVREYATSVAVFDLSSSPDLVVVGMGGSYRHADDWFMLVDSTNTISRHIKSTGSANLGFRIVLE